MLHRKPNKSNETLWDNHNSTDQEIKPTTTFRNWPKTLIFIMLLLVGVFYLLSIIPSQKQKRVETSFESPRSFNSFAELLTNPNQTEEYSFGWYQKQLELENKLGNVQFSSIGDRAMIKFGFQDTATTAENMFYYFRTFKPRDGCKKQATCEIYASQTASTTIYKEGIDLDAIVHYYKYEEPFNFEPFHFQKSNITKFHSIIEHSLQKTILMGENNLDGMKRQSNHVDSIYGEKMWRGMRRLTLFMNSEAIVDEYIKPLIQIENDSGSMVRFSKSTADISLCFQKTCSIWGNYLNFPIDFGKNRAIFGSKPLTSKKGICAFISNCKHGDISKKRLQILNKLSEYVPVRQYGQCGNNVKEGKGGKQFELENNCRFYYAAENSIVTDYVTEKFFQGLKAIENGAKLIILYKGAPNFNSFGFPKSFIINIDDYQNLEELGEYLKDLNENDDKFEKRFSQFSKQDRIEIDTAVNNMDYRIGYNTPCRMCKIIGEMKLARYLLFKIGLNPSYHKVNQQEWMEFRARFEFLGEERLKILDHIYFIAYSIFHMKDNHKNEFNLGWDFD